MKHSIKKLVSLALVLAISLVISIPAFADATDNSTFETAYSFGMWQSANSNDAPGLEKGQQKAYYKFTINQGEKIFVRCSYDKEYEGMYVKLYNSYKVLIDTAQSPNDVIDPETVIPFLPVDCDGTSDNQTYYIEVNRGTYDITKPIGFFISFPNRIDSGRGTFAFSGKATNPGNKNMSTSGVDSSILSLNLANNSNIPKGAIVKSVTTKGTLSAKLGGIYHVVMPASATSWYTSKVAAVSGAGTGSYDISESDGYLAAQTWKFKYNSLAGASSTMSDIQLAFTWTYDLKNNGYKIFLD